MSRQRSPDSKRAETLYRKGLKLSEIAEKLGVPASTVRRWKRDQDWESRLTEDKQPGTNGQGSRKPGSQTYHKPNAKNERSNRTQTKRKTNAGERTGAKHGAPYGNVNAVGNRGGGPAGNKYALKHGAYAAVYADVLTDEEMALAEGIPSDEEALLEEEIFLLTVRERRILKAINSCMAACAGKEDASQMLTGTVTKVEHWREFDGTPEEQAVQRALYEEIVRNKIEAGERMPGRDVVVTTNTEHGAERVLRMEKELTSVQSQKTKAINSLAQLRMAKQKAEGEGKGTDVVIAWAEAIANARGNADGES